MRYGKVDRQISASEQGRRGYAKQLSHVASLEKKNGAVTGLAADPGQLKQKESIENSPHQMKIADRLQRNFGAGRVPMIQREENKTGIVDGLKSRMETLHNADFSSVRVHQNSSKAASVGARAYTQGSDIHFAPGQFSSAMTGPKLLSHELTHVVQQREGRVQPTTTVNGMAVNDNPGLEKEADNMAGKA